MLQKNYYYFWECYLMMSYMLPFDFFFKKKLFSSFFIFYNCIIGIKYLVTLSITNFHPKGTHVHVVKPSFKKIF